MCPKLLTMLSNLKFSFFLFYQLLVFRFRYVPFHSIPFRCICCSSSSMSLSSSKSLSVVACYSLTTVLCHVAVPYIIRVFPNKVMKCTERTESGLSTNLQDTFVCLLFSIEWHEFCVWICVFVYRSTYVFRFRLFGYFTLIMFYGRIASLWMLLQCVCVCV